MTTKIAQYKSFLKYQGVEMGKYLTEIDLTLKGLRLSNFSTCERSETLL
jgi:hypothetical protein